MCGVCFFSLSRLPQESEQSGSVHGPKYYSAATTGRLWGTPVQALYFHPLFFMCVEMR